MISTKKSPTWSACPIISAAANITIQHRKAGKNCSPREWRRSGNEKRSCGVPKKAATQTRNQNSRNAEEPRNRKIHDSDSVLGYATAKRRLRGLWAIVEIQLSEPATRNILENRINPSLQRPCPEAIVTRHGRHNFLQSMWDTA